MIAMIDANSAASSPWLQNSIPVRLPELTMLHVIIPQPYQS
jgi:hypothetical protein